MRLIVYLFFLPFFLLTQTKLNKVELYIEKYKDLAIDHMFEYGKYNFHKIIQKHPAYRNELGYRWTTSFWRGFLFNSLNVLICSLLLKKINNSLLVKFLVINSFIKGARASDIK